MAIPTYKDIVDLMKKGATVEAQERIMELREAVLELQEENVSLRQNIRQLEEQLSLEKELGFDGSVYWRTTGGNRIGPFCQRCHDVDKKLVRLQDYGDAWFCLGCKMSHDKNMDAEL